MTQLHDRLINIKARISEAAQRVGRDPEEITLVAVTKTIEPDIINDAIKYGVTDIGENRVQEIGRKYDAVNTSAVRWHLIGHLQTNKVKYIIDKVDLIHSVDSYKLAEEISKRASTIGKIMDVLVQVNVSGEESKFGVTAEECMALIPQIAQLSHIRVKGLMTIAPYVENAEEVRPYFRKLKQLAVDIKTQNHDNISMDYLSMGMTGDFEVAIEEGASIVRVGTALFGARSNA